MIRLCAARLRWLCFVVAAAISFSAFTDASGITSGYSTAHTDTFSSKVRQHAPWPIAFVTRNSNLLPVRGGSDDGVIEYDNEYDSESDDEEKIYDGSSDFVGIAINKSTKTLSLVGSIMTKLAKKSIAAVRRAIKAGLESHNTDEADDKGLVPKIADVILRMIKAAFNFDDRIDDVPESVLYESDVGSEEEDQSSVEIDFGSVLSKAYGVRDNRGEDAPAILGDSLTGALEIARSQARMLIIFLPAHKPSRGKKTKDNVAVESILSAEVAQAASKRARKKGGETGSFLFWAANSGSPESIAAMKRLKGKLTPQKGEKRPILAVLYPVLVSCSTL